MFSVKSNKAKRAYLKYMSEQEPEEIEYFYSKKNLPSILGDDDFKEWIKEQFSSLRFNSEIPESKELALGSSKVQELVCKTFRVDLDALQHSKRGTENIPRDVAIYVQRKYCGQTLIELGKDFGMDKYSSVSSAIGRTKHRISNDKGLAGKINKITEKIDKGRN